MDFAYIRRMEDRPDLSNILIRTNLRRRPHAYWWPLANGRMLGYSRPAIAETHWIARYRRKNGKYRQFRFGRTDDRSLADGETVFTFEQAIERAWQWFRTAEVARDAGDPNPLGRMKVLLYCPVGSTITLGHALQEYLDWKRLSSAATHYDIIVSLINYHILPGLGPLGLEELKSEHFRNCFQVILETPPRHGHHPPGPRRPIASLDSEDLRKRKKTVNALITILRDSLRLAWENGRTNNDRLWRSLRPLPNVDRPRMLHLSRVECRALLKNCRPDLKRLVLGALYTGCRSLELLRMKVCDVGKDGYGVYVLPAKTRTSRFVFLPDEGMTFFLHLIKNRPQHAPLFVREDGKSWGQSYRNPFKTALRAAGLPLEFTFHGLRHTYASQLVQAGAPLVAVADQLGHANTVTVSRTYGHVSPQIRESEVRQRFTVLDTRNANNANRQKKTLARWRSQLHGSKSGTYARIMNLKNISPDA